VTPSSGDDVKAGDDIFFQTGAGIFKLAYRQWAIDTREEFEYVEMRALQCRKS
jgi:hypothetical protein